MNKVKITSNMSPEDERVRQWRQGSNMILLYSPKYYKNLYDLESDYDAYNLMPTEMQFDSNEESIRIFKMNNEDRYEIMKNKFLTQSDKDVPVFKAKYIPDEKIYSNPDTLISLMREEMDIKQGKIASKFSKLDPESNDYRMTIHYMAESANNDENKDLLFPMYTPEEMINLGTSYSAKNLFSESAAEVDSLDESEWFTEYKKVSYGGDSSKYRELYPFWKDSIKELYSLKENSDDESIYNQTLIDLGWNPAVKPTEKNFKKVSDRAAIFRKLVNSNFYIFDMDRYLSEGVIIGDNYKNYIKNNDIKYYYLGLRCGSDIKEYPNYNIFNVMLYTNDSRLSDSQYGYRDVDINIDISTDKLVTGHYKKYGRSIEEVFLVKLNREDCMKVIDRFFDMEDEYLDDIYNDLNTVEIQKSDRLGIKLFIAKTLLKDFPLADINIYKCKYTFYNNIVDSLAKIEYIMTPDLEK